MLLPPDTRLGEKYELVRYRCPRIKKQSKYEGRQDNKRATKRRINGPDLEPGKREECRNRDPFSKNRGLFLDHALV